MIGTLLFGIILLVLVVLALVFGYIRFTERRRKYFPLVDRNFWPQPSCSKHGSLETDTEYGWRRPNGADKTVVYTDLCLWEPMPHDHRKVAWILEPEAIHPEPYQKLRELGENHPFEFVFVSCRNSGISREVYVPNAMTHALESKQKIPASKSKHVCVFASGKNKTPGHQLRNASYSIVPEKDRYGRAHGNFVKYKSDVLPKYQFCLVIENCSVPGYFSEKIIDCFLCGVVPIYWGDPEIGRVFDDRGIIPFRTDMTEKDLPKGDEYEKRMIYIKRNYETAKKYRDERRVFQYLEKHCNVHEVA